MSIPFSTRKVGGIRFLRLGRMNLSLPMAAAFRPLKDTTCPPRRILPLISTRNYAAL